MKDKSDPSSDPVPDLAAVVCKECSYIGFWLFENAGSHDFVVRCRKCNAVLFESKFIDRKMN